MLKKVFWVLLGVFLFNLFIFENSPGLGLGLAFLFLNLFFFSQREEPAGNLTLAVFFSLLSTFLGFLIAFRANEIVLFLDFLAAGFLSLSAFYFYHQEKPFSFSLKPFLLVPLQIGLGFFAGLRERTLKNSRLPVPVKNPRLWPLAKGFLIAGPIFFLLFLLFVQADPVFAKLSEKFFINFNDRFLFSLFVAGFLTAFLVIKVKEVGRKEVKLKDSAGKTGELLVIVGSLIVLFTGFILIQFRYLFSSVGERELYRLGISALTYSDYVRRGFFELLVVAGISLAVIGYIFEALHLLPGRQKTVLQLFTGLFTFESLLLLLSAGKRLLLYAQAHGLTRARIMGAVFLLWLGLIFCLCLWRVFREIKGRKLFGLVFLFSLAALVFINSFNLDYLLATRYPPTVNAEIDYYYLLNLSPDAHPIWPQALAAMEREIAGVKKVAVITPEENRRLIWTRMTLSALDYKLNYLSAKYQSGRWQSLNLSEYQAYEFVTNQGTQNRLDQLKTALSAQEERVTNEVRQDTSLDRSLKPPLLH